VRHHHTLDFGIAGTVHGPILPTVYRMMLGLFVRDTGL